MKADASGDKRRAGDETVKTATAQEVQAAEKASSGSSTVQKNQTTTKSRQPARVQPKRRAAVGTRSTRGSIARRNSTRTNVRTSTRGNAARVPQGPHISAPRVPQRQTLLGSPRVRAPLPRVSAPARKAFRRAVAPSRVERQARISVSAARAPVRRVPTVSSSTLGLRTGVYSPYAPSLAQNMDAYANFGTTETNDAVVAKTLNEVADKVKELKNQEGTIDVTPLKINTGASALSKKMSRTSKEFSSMLDSFKHSVMQPTYSEPASGDNQLIAETEKALLAAKQYIDNASDDDASENVDDTTTQTTTSAATTAATATAENKDSNATVAHKNLTWLEKAKLAIKAKANGQTTADALSESDRTAAGDSGLLSGRNTLPSGKVDGAQVMQSVQAAAKRQAEKTELLKKARTNVELLKFTAQSRLDTSEQLKKEEDVRSAKTEAVAESTPSSTESTSANDNDSENTSNDTASNNTSSGTTDGTDQGTNTDNGTTENTSSNNENDEDDTTENSSGNADENTDENTDGNTNDNTDNGTTDDSNTIDGEDDNTTDSSNTDNTDGENDNTSDGSADGSNTDNTDNTDGENDSAASDTTDSADEGNKDDNTDNEKDGTTSGGKDSKTDSEQKNTAEQKTVDNAGSKVTNGTAAGATNTTTFNFSFPLSKELNNAMSNWKKLLTQFSNITNAMNLALKKNSPTTKAERQAEESKFKKAIEELKKKIKAAYQKIKTTANNISKKASPVVKNQMKQVKTAADKMKKDGDKKISTLKSAFSAFKTKFKSIFKKNKAETKANAKAAKTAARSATTTKK